MKRCDSCGHRLSYNRKNAGDVIGASVEIVEECREKDCTCTECLEQYK